jgi:hypothetical protein
MDPYQPLDLVHCCYRQHPTGSTIHKSWPRAPTALKLCILYKGLSLFFPGFSSPALHPGARNRRCGTCILITLFRLALVFPSTQIAGGAFPIMSNHYPIALGRLRPASRSADGTGLGQPFRPRVLLQGWPARAAHPELSCKLQNVWVCANDFRCPSAPGSGSSGTRCIRMRAPPPPPASPYHGAHARHTTRYPPCLHVRLAPRLVVGGRRHCAHSFCGRSGGRFTAGTHQRQYALSSLAAMRVLRARVQWSTLIAPPARPVLVLRWPASRPAHTSHSTRDCLPQVDHGHHA